MNNEFMNKFLEELLALGFVSQAIEARKNALKNMEITEVEMEFGKLLGGRLLIKVIFDETGASDNHIRGECE